MHLPVNTLLQGGKYRIVRFISSGGFGCTYEAEHVLLEERIAIKEFFVKDFCNRDETTSHVTVGTVSKTGLVDKLRRKFIDEAKALRKLHHEGIVQVQDVFEENGTAYYVMDYVRGRSLSDIVNHEGPLSESRAVGYIRQVASALQYVHDNNRLHLDIKPGNIMIDGGDNPILIDFGASKQYDEVDGENTSTLLGKTPGYAPPEQMSNSVAKFLPATDIYALGATLYKMLTGITPPDSLLRISGEQLGPLPSAISSSTREAVAAAMQMNKTARPQSLAEFLKLLQGSSGAGGGEETEVDGGRPADPEVVEPPKTEQSPKVESKGRSLERYKGFFVGAAVVVGVVVGFLLFQHRRGAEDRLVSEVVSDSVLQDSLTGVRAEAVDTVSSAALLAAQREQEEQARLAEEQRRKAEEAERLRLAEEQRKKEEAAAAEQRRKAEEAERQRLAEEQRRKAEEAERQRLAEEQRKKEEAAAAEQRRKTEEAERQRLAEEQRRKAEEAERQRLAEEQRKKAEAAAALQRERQRIIDLFDMVYVAGGTFTMGATAEQRSYAESDEKPAHSVTLSSYYIGKYEVTQKQWVEIMGSNPSVFKGDNLPVENVSWNDVQEFLRRLNAKTGKRYRLPTEAEWEYAARGGNRSRGYKYSGSNDVDMVAWYNLNSGYRTHPVGSKSPNELGIYDMSGNVWEWCSDWYGSNYYYSKSSSNPQGPATSASRVLRGGGWDYNDGRCRVSCRLSFSPGIRSSYFGFRLVLSL